MKFIFTQITTRAADDLHKVYDLANSMVKKLGMSEKIGYMSFKEHEIVKIYSEETQKVLELFILSN